jgi:uncharacterized protein (DUF2342 family)
MNTNTATIISAIASMLYVIVSAISLWLLTRQIRDARRFGAAPALHALLKEMDDHIATVRKLGDKSVADTQVRDGVCGCLDFFERVEHMRSAGVMPTKVLRRAFGYALETHLADPRFFEVIQQDVRQYEEVLILARHIGQP